GSFQELLVIRDVGAETQGNGQQARCLRRSVQRVSVGRAHNLREARQRCILEMVFPEKGIEAAQRAGVSEFDSRHVKGDRALLLRDCQHLCGRHIINLCIRVDEAADEPRARQAVDLGPFTGDPFHRGTPVEDRGRFCHCHNAKVAFTTMQPPAPAWLLLVTNLPGHNPTLRMRFWRALKAAGAGLLRDGAYLLPNGERSRQVLEEQGSEIKAAGGMVQVLSFDADSPEQNAEFIGLFDRTEDYADAIQRLDTVK